VGPSRIDHVPLPARPAQRIGARDRTGVSERSHHPSRPCTLYQCLVWTVLGMHPPSLPARPAQRVGARDRAGVSERDHHRPACFQTTLCRCLVWTVLGMHPPSLDALVLALHVQHPSFAERAGTLVILLLHYSW
jgi:hypothetical protein